MSEATDVKDTLLRALRNLTIATVVAYLLLVGLGVFVWVDADNRRQELESVARDTNSALCSLRGDLERRAEASEKFLKENPEGIPGISAQDIQTGLDNQLRTIQALSGLDCSVLN